jgi:pimeloyl-ACP methyl ester carboxylesterase
MRNLIIKNQYDGINIPAVFYESQCKNQNEKNFVFFHGLTTDKYEYLDFYKILGKKLSELGHNVLCFDARAHGESERSSTEFTIPNLVSDGIEVIKWLLKEKTTSKVSLFGTSFGAIPTISISYMLSEIVNKVFLLAPAIDLEKLYIKPINEERTEKYRGLVNQCVFQGKPFYINEKVFFNRSIVSDFQLINLIECLKRSNIKYEIMHGTQDSMIPYELSKNISEESKNIILHTFENMDHGFMDVEDEDGTTKKSQENMKRIISILTA